MIKEINNEYGGVTTINYTTSTQFNNSEDGTSDIGFNIFVVSNVTSNNSIGVYDNISNTTLNDEFLVISSTSYNYSWGKYNYEDSEFRGFGKTTETSPSRIVNHYFYQDDPRRGKEFKTEVYSNDTLYSKSVKDYNYTFNDGLYNLSLIFSSSYLYDGLETPKITNKTFTYDSLGNPEKVFDHGDISITGDERTTEYTYAYHTGNWIVNKVASVTVYDYLDDKVKETKFYYDNLGLNGMGSKGALTKTERWNSDGNNSFGYFDYNSYGNIITQTDSLGNSVKYSYDAFNTYPDSMTNALGHISYYSYDLGTGNLDYEEKNDIRKSFVYDTFGRISKEIMPYDTVDSPTKTYSYSFDGVAPESVKISLKTTADNSNDIYYFYDGLANIIQIKTDTENEQIVKNIFYDESYRVKKEQNHYFADSTTGLTNVSLEDNYTYYTYDVLDRVIGVLNPDATSKNVTFNQYEITDFDENGNKHMYELDAHGRIIAVYEYNTNDVDINETYTTTYEYDSLDNLIKIIDNENNEFIFTYDSLSRKTAMDDPDLGSWSYAYDTNSNLVSQTDARSEVIFLTYDALNRIKSKNSDDVNITFNYDLSFYGTLSNLTSNNLTFKYEYDDRLRVTKETKTINGIDFSTSLIYDSQNRVISKRSEEHTSELQSHSFISYAVFCLKKKKEN